MRATTAIVIPFVGVLAAVTFTAPARGQEQPFPQPFVVEHHLVQSDAAGGTFETEPVTDYYGGAFIVSVRPDRSRLVVDLARRELTEVRSDRGTYSVMSFARFAELSRRLVAAEGRIVAAGFTASVGAARDEDPAARIEIEEVSPPASTGNAGGGADTRSGASPLSRPVVRHFRARVLPSQARETSSGARAPLASVEVWVDPTVRLTEAGRSALAAFESGVLAAGRRDQEPGVTALVSAVRQKADGAFPIRVVRPLSAAVSGAGRSEDVATRLEPVAAFPVESVQVPEGMQRVAHPLEVVVAHAESEAELNRKMGHVARREQP